MEETLYTIFAVFTVQFILGLIFGLSYLKKWPSSRKGDELKELSVVIPFRNEADRIGPLLQSINALILPESFSVEFIFVDDHSDDGAVGTIRDELKKSFKIVKPEDFGKKKAIECGVSHARFGFILTWDADIEVDPYYFKEIANLSEADLWILPVEMAAEGLIARFGKIEFDWMQMLSFTMTKWQRPLLCNGANLLFSKAAFYKAMQRRGDNHIASGDDMFLLNSLKEQGADIRASKKEVLQVKTNGPSSGSALYQQRRRWSTKMKSLISMDNLLLFFGLGGFNFLGLATMVYAIITLNLLFLVPLVLKLFNELVFLLFYRGFKRTLMDFPILLLHTVFYSFFLIAVLLPIPLSEKRWDDHS